MRKNIIFLSHIPLSDHLCRKFWINDLINRGYSVSFYDISRFFPYTHKNNYLPDNKINLYSVASLEYFEYLISRSCTTSIYINLFYPSKFDITYGIYRILARYNCIISTIIWGRLPNINSSRLLSWSYFLYILNPSIFFSRLNFVLFKFSYPYLLKFNILKPFNFVFAAGSYCSAIISNTKFVIPVNLCDNDEVVLKSSSIVSNRSKPYVVFIDSNITNHPDMLTTEYVMNPDTYYSKMNKVFETIELFGFEVIVLEHPTSNHLSSKFNNRKSVRSDTCSFVYNSNFVISHQSTAISYAILCFKPIVLISTIEMSLCLDNPIPLMHSYSKLLGIPLYSAENFNDNFILPSSQVDEKLYSNFMYRYLVSKGSEYKLNINIVLNFLENHFG